MDLIEEEPPVRFDNNNNKIYCNLDKSPNLKIYGFNKEIDYQKIFTTLNDKLFNDVSFFVGLVDECTDINIIEIFYIIQEEIEKEYLNELKCKILELGYYKIDEIEVNIYLIFKKCFNTLLDINKINNAFIYDREVIDNFDKIVNIFLKTLIIHLRQLIIKHNFQIKVK
jgi:hypothetical protein